MKKVLIFLLVIGVLMMGTCVFEEISDKSSEYVEFLDELPSDDLDPVPYGGHGGDGGGPIPG